MKELKSLFVALIVIGIITTGLLAFINPFVNTYGVEEPDTDSAYNHLAELTNKTSQAEDDLKGIDDNTSGGDLAVIITKSAYKTMVGALKSIPILGKMFVYLAEDLGIPSSILMGALSIIIIGIVFGLALLFLQVIK